MRNSSEGVSRHTLRGTCLKVFHGTRYVELVCGCVTAHVTWNLSVGVSRHTLRRTCLRVCHGTRYVELVWGCVMAHVTWNLSEGVLWHTLRGTCLESVSLTDTLIGRFQSTHFYLLKLTFQTLSLFPASHKNKNIESSFLAIPGT